mgnify:CR=1 FL=1
MVLPDFMTKTEIIDPLLSMPGSMPKTINLQLVGLDENAFFLLVKFQQKAEREGWSEEEITKVLDEATSDEYDHLVATLSNHCNPIE